MNEAFLHYVWQFQYFQKKSLVTTDGEELHVFQTGSYNTHAGPDFLNARIKIGTLEWNGHVELHLRSSDWLIHQHQHDALYDNVVLHVVWNHDHAIVRSDGSEIPTIELKNRVDPELIKRYRKLVESGFPIPCRNSLQEVPAITRLAAMEQALVQRLESKAWWIRELLQANKGDWEETAYQVLAKNFGFKVNSDPFLKLAQATPYKIIRKHTDNLLQVEALLFGQAGMLGVNSNEAYVRSLYQEYQFLSHKYSFESPAVTLPEWRFLRLRPANFPTLRLAQFAAILHQQPGIFSKLIETKDAHQIKKWLHSKTSPYWQEHYRFGKKSKSVSEIGEASVTNVMINSVAPLLVAYGKALDNEWYIEQALTLLQNVSAEENKITRAWKELGIECSSAFDSQALIELFNNSCTKRNCLHCSIGSYLIKPALA